MLSSPQPSELPPPLPWWRLIVQDEDLRRRITVMNSRMIRAFEEGVGVALEPSSKRRTAGAKVFALFPPRVSSDINVPRRCVMDRSNALSHTVRDGDAPDADRAVARSCVWRPFALPAYHVPLEGNPSARVGSAGDLILPPYMKEAVERRQRRLKNMSTITTAAKGASTLLRKLRAETAIAHADRLMGSDSEADDVAMSNASLYGTQLFENGAMRGAVGARAPGGAHLPLLDVLPCPGFVLVDAAEATIFPLGSVRPSGVSSLTTSVGRELPPLATQAHSFCGASVEMNWHLAAAVRDRKSALYRDRITASISVNDTTDHLKRRHREAVESLHADYYDYDSGMSLVDYQRPPVPPPPAAIQPVICVFERPVASMVQHLTAKEAASPAADEGALGSQHLVSVPMPRRYLGAIRPTLRLIRWHVLAEAVHRLHDEDGHGASTSSSPLHRIASSFPDCRRVPDDPIGRVRFLGLGRADLTVQRHDALYRSAPCRESLRRLYEALEKDSKDGHVTRLGFVNFVLDLLHLFMPSTRRMHNIATALDEWGLFAKGWACAEEDPLKSALAKQAYDAKPLTTGDRARMALMTARKGSVSPRSEREPTLGGQVGCRGTRARKEAEYRQQNLEHLTRWMVGRAAVEHRRSQRDHEVLYHTGNVSTIGHTFTYSQPSTPSTRGNGGDFYTFFDFFFSFPLMLTMGEVVTEKLYTSVWNFVLAATGRGPWLGDGEAPAIHKNQDDFERYALSGAVAPLVAHHSPSRKALVCRSIVEKLRSPVHASTATSAEWSGAATVMASTIDNTTDVPVSLPEANADTDIPPSTNPVALNAYSALSLFGGAVAASPAASAGSIFYHRGPAPDAIDEVLDTWSEAEADDEEEGAAIVAAHFSRSCGAAADATEDIPLPSQAPPASADPEPADSPPRTSLTLVAAVDSAAADMQVLPCTTEGRLRRLQYLTTEVLQAPKHGTACAPLLDSVSPAEADGGDFIAEKMLFEREAPLSGASAARLRSAERSRLQRLPFAPSEGAYDLFSERTLQLQVGVGATVDRDVVIAATPPTRPSRHARPASTGGQFIASLRCQGAKSCRRLSAGDHTPGSIGIGSVGGGETPPSPLSVGVNSPQRRTQTPLADSTPQVASTPSPRRPCRKPQTPQRPATGSARCLLPRTVVHTPTVPSRVSRELSAGSPSAEHASAAALEDDARREEERMLRYFDGHPAFRAAAVARGTQRLAEHLAVLSEAPPPGPLSPSFFRSRNDSIYAAVKAQGSAGDVPPIVPMYGRRQPGWFHAAPASPSESPAGRPPFSASGARLPLGGSVVITAHPPLTILSDRIIVQPAPRPAMALVQVIQRHQRAVRTGSGGDGLGSILATSPAH